MTPVTEKIKEFRQNSLRIYRQLEEERRKKTTVTVHLGICGASVGAKEVLRVFQEMVGAGRLDKDISVEVAGCLGLCSQEPIIRVAKPGMREVAYCLVTPEMAKVIFNQHIIHNVIIQPWSLAVKMERRQAF